MAAKYFAVVLLILLNLKAFYSSDVELQKPLLHEKQGQRNVQNVNFETSSPNKTLYLCDLLIYPSADLFREYIAPYLDLWAIFPIFDALKMHDPKFDLKKLIAGQSYKRVYLVENNKMNAVRMYNFPQQSMLLLLNEASNCYKYFVDEIDFEKVEENEMFTTIFGGTFLAKFCAPTQGPKNRKLFLLASRKGLPEIDFILCEVKYVSNELQILNTFSGYVVSDSFEIEKQLDTFESFLDDEFYFYVDIHCRLPNLLPKTCPKFISLPYKVFTTFIVQLPYYFAVPVPFYISRCIESYWYGSDNPIEIMNIVLTVFTAIFELVLLVYLNIVLRGSVSAKISGHKKSWRFPHLIRARENGLTFFDVLKFFATVWGSTTYISLLVLLITWREWKS